MYSNLIRGFFAIVAVGLMVATSFADVFVPAGLNPGDYYHLIFTTSGAMVAQNDDIAVYNLFVNTQAALNPALTGTDMGVNWSAIASTPTVDAIDNALVEAPVYLFDSTLVANGFADIWDGDIASPIFLDQFGNSAGAFDVWTGSGESGLGDPGLELGSTGGVATKGSPFSTDSQWIAFEDFNLTQANSFYAISQKLTVIPEPSSLLFCCCACFAGLRRRRDATI